jgi:hypothetical protein
VAAFKTTQAGGTAQAASKYSDSGNALFSDNEKPKF